MPELSKSLPKPGSFLPLFLGAVAKARRSRLLGHVATVFSGNSAAMALSAITTWIVVRHLAPQDYGVFSVINTVTGVSAGILATGFNWAMVKSVASLGNDEAKAWAIARGSLKIQIIYAFSLAAVLFIAADPLAKNFFQKPELIPFLRLCGIGVIGTILLNYRNSIFRALRQFKKDALFTLVQTGAYLAFVILLLGSGRFEIYPVAVGYVIIPGFISVIALALIRDKLRTPGPADSLRLLSEMGRAYLWLLIYTLCLWVAAQLHMIVITRYFPLQEVGLYGFAYKIYTLALSLMNAINIVLLPTFSAIGNREVLARSLRKIFKATTAVSVCLFLCIPFMGTFVLLFAETAYLDATVMVQIFIMGAAFSTMFSPPVNVLFALGRYKLIAMGGIAMVFFNLVGHLTLTIRFGGIGAAMVQVCSYLILCGYVTYHAFRLCKLQS